MLRGTHISKFSSILAGFGLTLVAGLGISSQSAMAQATVTKIPFNALTFVPCADDGNGEIVALEFTLHLVDRGDGGLAEVGTWSNATGIGLTTGQVYRGSVVSTAIPDSDEYLTAVSLQAGGPDGVHFTLTRIGPLFAPPTEVIQAHCR